MASLLAPAVANAASKKKVSKPVYPTISSISPRQITIGQKLTVKGAHFRAGKGKNSVAFYRSGKPVVFVKADTATSSKLVVTISTKVAGLLAQNEGVAIPTQLRLRVIAAKMGKTWTKNSRSPRVSPLPGAAGAAAGGGPITEQQAAALAYQTCQEKAAATPAVDVDNDGLTNGSEAQYGLDPCTADTDGDGLIDGYEFFSAVDLNGAAIPYPGKRPWPNALDPSDSNYDFDGDGLLLWQEYKLWQATGAHFPLTQYSDGTQNTGGTQPALTQAQQYLDLDGDHNLTDDERDEDGDGLSNNVEFNYRGTQAWWRGIDWGGKPHAAGNSYIEPAYTLRAFSDPDPTNADSDGDGVPDAADDQDADGWDNFTEMQLSRHQSGYRVQPFNPCLPNPHSRTCSRYIPLNGANAWPPFDKVSDIATSGMPDEAIPFAWPYVWWDDYNDAIVLDPANANHYVGTVFGPWTPTPSFENALPSDVNGGWDGTSGPQGP